MSKIRGLIAKQNISDVSEMSNSVPGKYELRIALIYCYHLNKTAAEAHRTLVQVYGERALGKSQCFEWFKKFKSGDFDVRNEVRGKPPKKFEDGDLQALLDEDDPQTQKQLADRLNVTREAVATRLKTMGKVRRMGKWVPRESSEDHSSNGAHRIEKKAILESNCDQR